MATVTKKSTSVKATTNKVENKKTTPVKKEAKIKPIIVDEVILPTEPTNEVVMPIIEEIEVVNEVVEETPTNEEIEVVEETPTNEVLTDEKRFLREAGLDWKVITDTMQTSTDGVLIPKAIALFREDTKQFLSIRGEGYEVYQNEQLIDLLLKVSEQTGLSLHKGGFFGNGEKVFLQLKSTDFKLGNDRIEGYITGVNSFDGTTSLAFGPSNITISCQNTFFAAFRELKTKVRHTKNMVIRIEDILKQLDKSLIEEKKIFENIQRLSEERFTSLHKDFVVRQLFDIKQNVLLSDEEEVSTYKRNRIELLNNSISNQVQEKGDNLWGLFSGVTHYTTHVMKKDEDNSEEKLFGHYGNRERNIFHSLVEIVH